LAGKARRDDVNQSLIACGVPVTDEFFDIAEYRGVWQDSVFDSCGNDTLAVVIPFDVSDWVPSKQD